ncbi:MAG: tail fiber protein [Candidatus Nanopelagicales bacterium]|nr:tail fiber protein [Candidatus Nanopelagicales bacterium]
MRVRVFNSSLMDGEGAISVGSYVAQAPVYMMRPATEADEVVQMQYVQNKASVLDVNNFTTGILHTQRLGPFGGKITKVGAGSAINISVGSSLPAGLTVTSRAYVGPYGYVTDTSSLTAANIPGQSWTKLSGLPNTRGGYGITDLLGLNGGTVTGNITLDVADPTAITYSSDLQTVTKAYVDAAAAASGGSSGPLYVTGDIRLTASDVAPAGYIRANGGNVLKSTYPDLYTRFGNKYDYRTIPGAGRPWEQQYHFNKLNHQVNTNWGTGTSMSSAVSDHQCVVVNNKAYILGGKNSAGTTIGSTLVADLTAFGQLTNGWTAGVSLPAPRQSARAVVLNNNVLLLGGALSGGTVTDSIAYATVGATGLITSWLNWAAVLPGPRKSGSVAIIRDRLFYFGGRDATNTVQSTVYSIAITGSPGSEFPSGEWRAESAMPVALSEASLVVTDRKVYMIGGVTNTTGPWSGILSADIQQDGRLSAWTTHSWTVSGSPAYRHRCTMHVTADRVYLFSGMVQSNAVVTDIISTSIDRNTGLMDTGAWRTDLPYFGEGVADSQMISVKNLLVRIGGEISNGTISPAIYRTQIPGGSDYYPPYTSYLGNLTPSNSFGLPDLSEIEERGVHAWIKS